MAVGRQNKENQKTARPLRSGLVVSSLTFLSRIFGLARDIILAASFGGTAVLDAFLVAFRIPNFFRRLFAEGAFVQSFLPIVVEFQSKEEKEKLKTFISQTLGFMLVLAGTICALGVIFSEYLTFIFAPGFRKDPGQFVLTSSMLQITFPYLFFITITAYFMALQNSENKFALPAFTPVILNLCLIFAVVVAANRFEDPIMAAAWAVFVGGAIQLFIQLPAVYRCGLLHIPRFRLSIHPSVRRLLKVMTPVLLSGSVVQFNLMIDMLLASFLVAGSIAWLSFAERLIQLPLGVFGIAITTIMMPNLSRLYNTASVRATEYFVSWGVRLALIIALPASLGLILMAVPLLSSIYYYGAFSAEDVLKTSMALQAYALGLPGFILIKVLSSVFFSRQDTKTPLKVILFGAVLGIICSLSLVWSLKHVGLALATSISATFNATVLGIIVHRRMNFNRNTWRFVLRLVIALAALAIFLIYITPHIQISGGDWLAMPPKMRIINLMIIIPLAVVVYFSCLFIGGIKWRHINIKAVGRWR